MNQTGILRRGRIAAWMCALLLCASTWADTAYFDSLSVSNSFSQDNPDATNTFAGNVMMAKGLVVSSVLAVARQGDIDMGPYTNGQPASGMSGALPEGFAGALMYFDGSRWVAATNVSPDLILSAAGLAASAAAVASNAATAGYAAGVSNLAQSAYAAATQYSVADTLVPATGSVPTTAAVSNYLESVAGDAWSLPATLPSASVVTVNRASTRYAKLTLTNNATLTFDASGWDTSGVGRVSLELYTGPYALTFDTNVISGSSSLTLATNAFNGLLFRKTVLAGKWAVRQ